MRSQTVSSPASSMARIRGGPSAVPTSSADTTMLRWASSRRTPYPAAGNSSPEGAAGPEGGEGRNEVGSQAIGGRAADAVEPRLVHRLQLKGDELGADVGMHGALMGIGVQAPDRRHADAVVDARGEDRAR